MLTYFFALVNTYFVGVYPRFVPLFAFQFYKYS